MTVFTVLGLVVIALALVALIMHVSDQVANRTRDRVRFVERVEMALRANTEHHRQVVHELTTTYATSIQAANEHYRQLADLVITRQQEVLTTIIALAQNPNAANTILGLERMRAAAATAPRSMQEFIEQATGETARRDPDLYSEDGQPMVPVGL